MLYDLTKGQPGVLVSAPGTVYVFYIIEYPWIKTEIILKPEPKHKKGLSQLRGPL